MYFQLLLVFIIHSPLEGRIYISKIVLTILVLRYEFNLDHIGDPDTFNLYLPSPLKRIQTPLMKIITIIQLSLCLDDALSDAVVFVDL